MGFSAILTNIKMVDPSTYTLGVTSGDSYTISGDSATGAILAVTRALTQAVDSVAAHTPEPSPDSYVGPLTSTSTTFVTSASIDMANYDRINIIANKTTGSVAGDALFKIQWSHDQTTWMDDYVLNPAAGTTVAVTQTVTTAVAAGYATTQALNRQKNARYARIAQQSKTAATHTCEYHYSLM